jgi:small-conductance mechanosensitive channel
MAWETLQNESGALALLAVAVAVAGALAWGVMVGVGVLIRRHIPGTTGRRLRRPVAFGVAAAAMFLVSPLVGLGESAYAYAHHAASVLVIIAIGWLLIAVTRLGQDVIEHHYPVDVRDNRRARSVQTRFRVLRRVWIVLVLFGTTGAVCFTFPSIRTLGAGLLASAGVAGLVIGIAARPFIETLLASIQIALTEPIRLDDVLIVEGEWGRVEEIRATYVAVRIWDDRRLIVPLTYFIQQPFQNWTRTTADITGAVTLKVDFHTPVEAVREEVGRIVEGCEHWDKRFWNVQITDADDRTMTLRVLATAADASAAWDLRCYVRERLVAYLQREHPGALPRLRAVVAGNDDAADEEPETRAAGPDAAAGT